MTTPFTFRCIKQEDHGKTSATMTGVGVSTLGTRQFLNGEPVTQARDRQLLAQALTGALELAAPSGKQTIGLLLPAIQKVRESA